MSNSIHVTALGDRDSCASLIYLSFVRDLRPGDTSCTSKVPEIRVVPRFAESVDEVDAGQAEPGNQATGIAPQDRSRGRPDRRRCRLALVGQLRRR